MRYKVLKNVFVLGKLCKMGTHIEIKDEDLKYYEGVVEAPKKTEPKKPTKKAVK